MIRKYIDFLLCDTGAIRSCPLLLYLLRKAVLSVGKVFLHVFVQPCFHQFHFPRVTEVVVALMSC